MGVHEAFIVVDERNTVDVIMAAVHKLNEKFMNLDRIYKNHKLLENLMIENPNMSVEDLVEIHNLDMFGLNSDGDYDENEYDEKYSTKFNYCELVEYLGKRYIRLFFYQGSVCTKEFAKDNGLKIEYYINNYNEYDSIEVILSNNKNTEENFDVYS